MNDGKLKLALVKISNNEVVPDDEPVFILRARDKNALETLCSYREICENNDCNDYQISGIDEVIGKFKTFQLNNPDRMKQPGITRGM